MTLQIYIAFHPKDYKAARTIGEALSKQFSVYGENIGSSTNVDAGIGALEEADLHLYLLSPASVSSAAFRQRYNLSRQHNAKTLPIVIQPLPETAKITGNYLDATNQLEHLIPQLQRYASQLAREKQPKTFPVSLQILLPAIAVLALTICGGLFALLPREDQSISDAPQNQVVAEATEESLVATDRATALATFTPSPEDTATKVPTETEGTAEATEEFEDLSAEETEEYFEDDWIYADFYADPLDGVAPLTVSVENFSEGEIVEYRWDFDGDGITDSEDANPLPYTYVLPGEYLLTLTVVGESGYEDSYTEYIFVFSEDEYGYDYSTDYLDFLPDPQYGEAPLTVQFEDISDGVFTNYAWDFNGDGVTDSTSPNPGSYTYTQYGDYEVTLTAVDSSGNAQTAYAYITVDAPLAPFAYIIAEPDYGTAPLTVNFRSEIDGTITQYQWDFDGNGTVDSTQQNPGNHTYTSPGEYDVLLTVTGPGGTFEDFWFIYVESPDPPYATIGVSAYGGTVPLTVTFTDLSIGDITSYAWDFNGDGVTDSTSRNPAAYTYTTAGYFNVLLTVTGPGGDSSDTLTIYVDEVEAPIADFTADPESGTAPLTVTFTNASSGDITSYAWDFDGDGVTDSTKRNPSAQTYTTPGEYEASLVVTGPGGESDPYSVLIEVIDPEATPEVTPEITPEVTESPTPEETAEATESPTPEETEVSTPEVTESPTPEETEVSTPEVTESPTPEETEVSTPEVTESPTPEPAVAGFSANPLTGVAPLTVLIANTSSGDIASVAWDFEGDGITDSTDPALTSVVYTNPGTYTLTLRLTGDDAGVSQATATIVVTAAETTPEVTAEAAP